LSSPWQCPVRQSNTCCDIFPPVWLSHTNSATCNVQILHQDTTEMFGGNDLGIKRSKKQGNSRRPLCSPSAG
uniref:Uncharacterized protein n=1 Tax=Cyanistes caeruleus TaxID=156563 RepID=A0A8C0ZAX9_CYACU